MSRLVAVIFLASVTAAAADCFQGKVGPYKHCVQCHPGKDANLGLLGCMECESGYKLIQKPTGSMTKTTICVAESAPEGTMVQNHPTVNIVKLAESVKELSTLVAAVVAGGLADTLSSPGPFTVFAPTNEAFAALPAGTLSKLMKPENKKELVDILTYHVLPKKMLAKDFMLSCISCSQTLKTVEGKLLVAPKLTYKDGIRVGASLDDLKKVIAGDKMATNGVVHIIDGVLIPPATPNIVKLAESVKDLSTLVAAVVAGGLADTLSSPGPFTVFAPTNEAFAALPAGVLTKLMKPQSKKELIDILTYHVLPEKVLSKDLKPFQAVKTVEGKPLHVTEWGGKVRLGPSLESKDLKNVIKADNLASNGVVHIIDGVLLPPSEATIMV